MVVVVHAADVVVTSSERGSSPDLGDSGFRTDSPSTTTHAKGTRTSAFEYMLLSGELLTTLVMVKSQIN